MRVALRKKIFILKTSLLLLVVFKRTQLRYYDREYSTGKMNDFRNNTFCLLANIPHDSKINVVNSFNGYNNYLACW